ncbi:MAG: DUF2809 domain-containing protein [Calditrichia bacterium]
MPTLLSLAIVVPVGFYTKFYSGPGSGWVHDSLGGVFYEIFWCLSIFLFFPQINVRKIAIGVFVATCVVEFSQLWHPGFLEFLRQYFLGRTILGTSFSSSDFLWYAMGSLLGWSWLKGLKRLQSRFGNVN